MVNLGLLTAEICWRVWGTPANFNSFHVLAALLHGTLVDLSSFFPRLLSAVGDWMSTILSHMVWP